MTANSGPTPPVEYATNHYRNQRDMFVANRELIEQRDPHAWSPDQLWLLGLDPVEILVHALRAELLDPPPPSEEPPVKEQRFDRPADGRCPHGKLNYEYCMDCFKTNFPH